MDSQNSQSVEVAVSNREKMATRIEELKSKENDLIQKLAKEHQIADCIDLLETLTERMVTRRMLDVYEVVKA